MDTGFRGGVAHDTNGLSRAFASTRIGLSALPTHGQAAQMADASIALDALKALEIHADFAAKIAFNNVLAILNGMHDLGELLFAQILCANGGVYIGLGQNVFRVAWADAVNVTQRDVDAFIRRNFYANDTSHIKTVLRVLVKNVLVQFGQRFSPGVVCAAHSSI